jgi:hypothetical protein
MTIDNREDDSNRRGNTGLASLSHPKATDATIPAHFTLSHVLHRCLDGRIFDAWQAAVQRWLLYQSIYSTVAVSS